MSSAVKRNSVANALQIIIGAGLIFFLYRYISSTLGVEKLGVWSTVLATASAARLADFGIGAGVTRFVARYLALNLPQQASRVVETSILSLSVLAALVLLGSYPLLVRILRNLFDAEYRPYALEILPFALVSMWLTLVASVAQSGLDGCERMVSRATLSVGGQCLMVVLAIVLVPSMGLPGLAWAQIAQGCFLLITAWVLLRLHLRGVSRIPCRWDGSLCREMFVYGVQVFIANGMTLLLEPLTKALMARFGGPAAVGYFEIANQVVVRVRTVIVAANQAIVPYVVQMAESNINHLAALYRQNVRVMIFVALPMFTCLVGWGSALPQLVSGAQQSQAVVFLQVSALAWLVNTISSPAYFVNMGAGNVGMNALAHLTMGAVNCILGVLFGLRYGGIGVAFGYSIALISGSAILIVVFQHRNAMQWSSLPFRENVVLIIVFVGSLLSNMAFFVPSSANYGKWEYYIFINTFFMMALVCACWAHPLMRRLWNHRSAR